ncbi:protein lozenge-like [Sycon ciliatum]|uniref:protein lozenge-like n=1 Tax=Sycon ciliatum TaxID=27933 RepID=UPI0031F660E0
MPHHHGGGGHHHHGGGGHHHHGGGGHHHHGGGHHHHHRPGPVFGGHHHHHDPGYGNRAYVGFAPLGWSGWRYAHPRRRLTILVMIVVICMIIPGGVMLGLSSSDVYASGFVATAIALIVIGAICLGIALFHYRRQTVYGNPASVTIVTDSPAQAAASAPVSYGAAATTAPYAPQPATNPAYGAAPVSQVPTGNGAADAPPAYSAAVKY